MNKAAALGEKQGPRTLFEAREVAGSATCKHYENVLSFKVSLFIQLV